MEITVMDIPTCPHCNAILILTEENTCQACRQTISHEAVEYHDPDIEQQELPDLSEVSAGELFPNQKVAVPFEPLNSMQLMELTRLVDAKSHPQKIDEYLGGLGYDEDQIETLLVEHGLRRRHLLQLNRAKTFARIFGVLLILIGIAASFGDFIYIGLIVLGIALLIFV